MPTLAAITLHHTGGGVTVVADLLWRVVRDQHPDARLLTMFSHENRPATTFEKARFAARLAGVQLLGQTDWVLFSHLGPAQVQNALPESRRRPYAVFLHGIEAWNPLSAAETAALTNAAVRIANSRYTARRIMAAHPNIGPVEACPLALPPDAHAAASAATDHVPDVSRLSVLVVGRMSASERYKGHDQLIDVWPQVVARVPGAQLVIAGGGDDAARLRAKAAAGSVADRILFTGYVSDAQLRSLYDQAALFALPSRGEGFGLVYLEAMTHGLPCVGSIHDAAPDVIVDFETGRLVDQGDPAAIAGVVADLLADEGKRRRMGEAGRARVQTEFGFERFSARMRALLAPLDASGTRRG